MYHSITFAKELALNPSGHVRAGQLKGTNTWDDWHLIPSSRPVIASPGVSTKFVEIPGKHGRVDMTTYLCGYPIYSDRSGNLEFYVDNDHEYWEDIRKKIANFLHGQTYKISLEDDPRFFWEGRFALDNWKSEMTNSKITISYSISPYKTALVDAGPGDLLWDLFKFDSNSNWMSNLQNISATSSGQNYTIPANTMPFTISVSTASADPNIQVTFGGMKATLTSSNRTALLYTDIPGSNTLNIKGDGTLSVNFRERSL